MFFNAFKVRLFLLPIVSLLVSCSSYESASYNNAQPVEVVHNMQTYKLYMHVTPSAKNVNVDEAFVEKRMLSFVENLQEAQQLSNSLQTFNPVGAYETAFNLMLSGTVGFAGMFVQKSDIEISI